MSAHTAQATPRRPRGRWKEPAFHAIMGLVSLAWIAPLVFVVFVAFRTFADITTNGLGSLPRSFSLDGFVTVFTDGLAGGAVWVWNDLIWALTVLRSEVNFPITAALLNVQGGFVSQWNVVAAGAMVAAVPTAIVFFAFQKHFVSGLTVGSTK